VNECQPLIDGTSSGETIPLELSSLRDAPDRDRFDVVVWGATGFTAGAYTRSR
jgi:hypothetical protein